MNPKLDERIVELIKQGKGFVGILAGSGSDDKVPSEGKPSHIEKIVDSIEPFGIPYGVNIYSAHKQPEELGKLLELYNKLVYPILLVGVAGGTDALSGTASWASVHPVISCPPDGLNHSCLTNPPGSSNAYIMNPGNVGLFAAQMFSHLDQRIRAELLDSRDKKLEGLKADNAKTHAKYLDRMLTKYGL